MPPILSNLTLVTTWANQVVNPGGFGPRGQGVDSVDFALVPNLTTFNQQWAGDVSIAPGAHYDFDFTTPTANVTAVAAGQNLDAESVNFGHLLSLFVDVNGSGSITLTPASANPIEWFFGAGPPGDSTIPVTDGAFLYANGGGPYPGYAISGSHKTMRLANVGASVVTVTMEIKGGNP